MNVIALLEARQGELIRKILEHRGLWHDPPTCAPPPIAPTSATGLEASRPPCDPTSSQVYEVAPDFLEYRRHKDQEQLDLAFEPWGTPQVPTASALDRAGSGV
jgi:hypothetical protein